MIHKRKTGATWWHRRKMERITERQTRADNRAQRKADKRLEPGDRPSLIITVITIVLSVATAVPSQLAWFLHKLANDSWTSPNAWHAVAMTLLVEVLCWLGAILYARSVRTSSVRLFRAVTFVFAALAAAINFDHGREITPTIGVVYALGSLMGVGAFELYMHRARSDARGMSLPEIRLWALRWRRHPLVMRAATGYRAVHGPDLSREGAWRMAWVAKKGAPEVPVPTTDPRVLRLLGPEPGDLLEAEPASTEPASGGVAVAEREVLSLPVDWDTIGSAGAVVDKFWPTLPAELGLAASSAEQPVEPPAEFRTEGTASSAPARPKRVPAPVATSTVPREERKAKPRRLAVRAGARNSGRTQFAATKAELTGTGDALTRIGAYLARAEASGQPIAELDRNHIAGQFNVSTRQVRNAINAYNKEKQQP